MAMVRYTILCMLTCLVTCAVYIGTASAQAANSCIRDFYVNKKRSESVSNQTTEYDLMISDMARQVGVGQTIKVVHCSFSQKVQAFHANGKMDGVPAGSYIIYNPDWLREVIGRDRDQAIVVFGHEFGHFINGHFSEVDPNQQPPDAKKELEADQFAGCAAARMGIRFDVLEDVIGRLRRDESNEQYSSREVSLSQAKQGFEGCGGRPNVCRIPQNGLERWGFEQIFERESNWRGGGYGQQPFCDEMSAELRRNFPNADEFERVSSTERTRDTCQPFRCIQYKYQCRIVVRADPVYLEKQSADCP